MSAESNADTSWAMPSETDSANFMGIDPKVRDLLANTLLEDFKKYGGPYQYLMEKMPTFKERQDFNTWAS